MKAKKLILIRHGDYIEASPCNLSDYGRTSIRQLAKKLLPEVREKEVAFLTSMANRAIQSAEVLKEVWEENDIFLDFEKKYELWAAIDGNQEARRLWEEEKKEVSVSDTRWLDEFLKTTDKEVIVITTHLDFVQDFPCKFGFQYKEVEKGHARVLNLETYEEVLL